MDKVLEYDEWYDLYEEDIYIELAEIGATRELDFNAEKEFETRYQKYLEEIHNKSEPFYTTDTGGVVFGDPTYSRFD